MTPSPPQATSLTLAPWPSNLRTTPPPLPWPPPLAATSHTSTARSPPPLANRALSAATATASTACAWPAYVCTRPAGRPPPPDTDGEGEVALLGPLAVSEAGGLAVAGLYSRITRSLEPVRICAAVSARDGQEGLQGEEGAYVLRRRGGVGDCVDGS